VATSDEQLKYQIALTLLPGIGPVLARYLVGYCGSVETVFKTKKQQLEKIPGIGDERAAAIINHSVFERAEKEVLFIRKHNITTLFYTDKDYPLRLKNCEDAPVLLFHKGNSDLNAKRMVAIVGTRNSTSYGKEITEELVKDFMKYNVTVISGMAYGIDIIAHKAAVKNNLPTIGVLAHGLDRLYPAIHRPVAEKMIDNGGLITEFLSETSPDKENFPQRNRVVAGMADAVIVIESALKGGALITADIANSYDRDVFAVAGRVNETYSQGANDLIRRNKAGLIQNAEHVAEMMNWDSGDSKKKQERQLKIFRELNGEEKVLVDLLKESGKLDIDTLMIRSGLTASKVNSTLFTLEMEGVLKTFPGKVFELS